jgi:hypothetical protein
MSQELEKKEEGKKLNDLEVDVGALAVMLRSWSRLPRRWQLGQL